LKRRIDSYEATKTTPNYYQQARELTFYCNENSNLKQLGANSRQRILEKLETNYRSFFGNLKNGKTSTPRFHGKSYFFTLEWIHQGYKLDEQPRILTLSQGRGYEKIEIQLPRDYGTKFTKIRQIVVKFDNKNFWISLIGDIDTTSYIDNQKYIAIDAGVTNISTLLTSDGNLEVTSNNDFSKNEKIADCLQSFVAKKKKNSKRYLRAQKKYRKLRRKTSNQRRNFQHHVAKNIVKNFEANTIFIEKLDTKSMSQANPYWHKLNRKTQNTGSMSLFLQLLAQKATRYGKKVVAIDPRNTSRMCHNCSKIVYC
jgi:putative transposase